eukprot:TRINITY_DN55018_c0_g1_i1.p1 TRINITY_DN55018_c0_g1~~TRINITY_DN55018_c0_g1_i1.p1  ORF type:complete len:855 (-),score=126.34 TRINITY_DN55018_c0_g1_i1:175-2739(-)
MPKGYTHLATIPDGGDLEEAGGEDADPDLSAPTTPTGRSDRTGRGFGSDEGESEEAPLVAPVPQRSSFSTRSLEVRSSRRPSNSSVDLSRAQKRRSSIGIEMPEVDLVQFTSGIYFSSENEGVAVADVMRIGNLSGSCSIGFHTEDGSALAGQKYEHVVGKVDFKDGEAMRPIEIPLIGDDSFDTTLEFSIVLEHPIGCSLGAYLRNTRMVVIDEDVFPSNEFAELINQRDDKGLKSVGSSLLKAYMAFVFLRVPQVWWKSVLMLSFDQLFNLYYLLTIYMKVYLVDTVLNLKDADTADDLWIPESRVLTALLLALCFSIPNVLLLCIDLMKVGPLAVAVDIRKHHRVNLFRKYLNYDDMSRDLVPVHDLATTLTADIPELAEKGYNALFDFWKNVGRIACVAFFMLQQAPSSAFPLIVYPVVVCFFLIWQKDEHFRLTSDSVDAESATLGLVVKAVNGFHLVASYMQRPTVVKHFEDILTKQRQASQDLLKHQFFSDQVVPVITYLSIGAYMALGAQEVIFGYQSLGAFLATINIYKDLGDRFERLAGNLNSFMQAIDPLVSLSIQFGLPTDVRLRRERNEHRRKYTKAALKEACSAGQHQVFWDEIPIALQGVSVSHVPALDNISVKIPQGSLVLIAGPHGSGKATLASIIGDMKAPHSGQVVYPGHLRTLEVSYQPLLLQYLSLYDNLIFGTPDADPQRVRQVAERLALSQATLDELNHDIAEIGHVKRKKRRMEDVDEHDMWYKKLSPSDRKMVNIARALIYNPNLLILHRPVDDVDFDKGELVMCILRDFVDQRGIELDMATAASRRPRTAFFTGGDHNAAFKGSVVDYVWELSPVFGLHVKETDGDPA